MKTKTTKSLIRVAKEVQKHAAESGAWVAVCNRRWITNQIELLKHRKKVRATVEGKEGWSAYDFWARSSTSIGLLQVVQYYEYEEKTFNVTHAAELLDCTRQFVSSLLKEARERGLVDAKNRMTLETERVSMELTRYLLANQELVKSVHHMSARFSLYNYEGIGPALGDNYFDTVNSDDVNKDDSEVSLSLSVVE